MDKFDTVMSNYPDMTLKFERMPRGLKGLTIGREITISNAISEAEQLQWLYEELGHVETSIGDISKYDSLENLKQERRARNWGIRKLLPKSTIDHYIKHHYTSDFEVANELGVQVSYLHEAGYIYRLLK